MALIYYDDPRELSRRKESPEWLDTSEIGEAKMNDKDEAWHALAEATLRNKQVGGDHYKKHPIQVWDIVEAYDLNFFEGNALKYLLRKKDNRPQDLQKAIHYLEKEAERASK